ncbi:MAG: RidA family protein [Nocardioidaceae bacterium]
MPRSEPSPVLLLRSPDLTDRVAYASAVDTRSRLVFTAGACPLDADGNTVAPGDFVAQARRTLQNLDLALRDSGAVVADVLKTTVYVASSSRADLVAVWQEVAAYFGEHDAPSTLLGVSVLGYPDQLVEVEVEAVAATPPSA